MKIQKRCNILLHPFNPIALRKAKIVYNFGLSECNGDKGILGNIKHSHRQKGDSKWPKSFQNTYTAAASCDLGFLVSFVSLTILCIL